MFLMRLMLNSSLALSLLGCVTASAPPDAGPGIARLSLLAVSIVGFGLTGFFAR